MHARAAFLLLIFFCAAVLPAREFTDDKPLPGDFAAEASAGEETAPEESPMTGLILRAGAGLLVVALITAGGVWLLRRNPGMRKYFGGAGAVRVLTRTYLGSKQSVFLLKVGDRAVLVGATPAGLSALSEITDPTEVTRLVAETESAKPQKAFRETLKEAIPASSPADLGSKPAPRQTRVAAPESEGARKLAAIRAGLERMHGKAVA